MRYYSYETESNKRPILRELFEHTLCEACMCYLRPQQGSVSSLIRANRTLRGSSVNTYRNTSRQRKNPKIISWRERERE